MIVATAGHVDHGKTSLIRQLTGVETDRLEEEKRRGLSINLGYAYLPRDSGTPIGFIDVPGHSRFINTMISGISGIDLGMLVIAADDGPMPQTLEHLDVLQLLGVKDLLVVISKIDRATPERMIEVTAQIQSLLDTGNWRDAALFAVSNTNGDGIAELSEQLIHRADAFAARVIKGHFHLSIDRAFTIKGAGLVVTGTATAGQINIGDSLQLLPNSRKLRVRGLRVHDQDAQQACAGQRCAINLAGDVAVSDIERGDWLAAPEVGPTSRRLDAQFSLLKKAPFALKQMSPVKLYIGARRVPGRIVFLDRDSGTNRLQPGEQCLVQLKLEGDVSCFRGQHFLLRDDAENHVLGGGMVLDPGAIAARKSRPRRIAYLKAMQADTPKTALADLLALGQLLNLTHFQHAWNLREDELALILPPTAQPFDAEAGQWLASKTLWDAAATALVSFVDQWHKGNPREQGIKASELNAALASEFESELVVAALTALLRRGDLTLSEGRILRAGYRPAVSAEAETRWNAFREQVARGGNQIPLLSELSRESNIAVAQLQRIAAGAVKNRLLYKLSERRYALPDQLLALCAVLVDLSQTEEPITVIAMKKHWGTGRNLTIEILEYFDSIRFTQRKGEARVVLDIDLPGRLFGG